MAFRFEVPRAVQTASWGQFHVHFSKKKNGLRASQCIAAPATCNAFIRPRIQPIRPSSWAHAAVGESQVLANPLSSIMEINSANSTLKKRPMGRRRHPQPARGVPLSKYPKVCQICQKVYFSRCRPQKFCSRGCWYKEQRQRAPFRRCPMCGRNFHPRVRRGEYALFCSKDCFGKCYRGANHWRRRGRGRGLPEGVKAGWVIHPI